MTTQSFSMLAGTLGLWLAALFALLLSFSRPVIRSDRLREVRTMAGVALALQALHFAEEYLHGFHRRFPELLGLAAWPELFFVTFNVVWLATWAVAIAGLGRFPRVALVPLWFLGIAAAVNGLAHPALAIAVDGYFPGLWSSAFVGIAGLLLLYRLLAATSAP